jgi:hypothetical protein
MYSMQLQQPEKPLKQQLHTMIWQDGKLSLDGSPDNMQEALKDPQALIWLDSEGDCSLSESMLRDVSSLY